MVTASESPGFISRASEMTGAVPIEKLTSASLLVGLPLRVTQAKLTGSSP